MTERTRAAGRPGGHHTLRPSCFLTLGDEITDVLLRYNNTTPTQGDATMPALWPVEYLGIEAVRVGVPRWHAAMAEGRRLAPKCDRVLRAGRRCRNISLPEARKFRPPIHRCNLHMAGDVWPRIDHIRRRRGKTLAGSENRYLRAAGLAMLRQVEVREIRRLWAIDP